MRIRYGIAVNLLSRAASVAVGMVLLALYLKILGVEAVGLIGFYGVLLNLATVVEHAFGVMVMRETARLGEMPGGAQQQRDLLRTMEAMYVLIALALAIGLTLAAPFIARAWLSSASLSPATIQACLVLMAWTVPLQLLFSLHLNALTGLERQVEAGILPVLLAVVRGGVALHVLLFIAATSEAYFASQLAAVAACSALSFWFTWRRMPRQNGRATLWPALLGETWRYVSGLLANAVLFVLLLQVDKLIVSAVLPLNVFGYYVLASTIASLPWSIVGPVTLALLPRFTRLLQAHAEKDMHALFHATSQFVSLAVLPAAAVALFHPEALVRLWTGDPQAAYETRLLVPLLIAGTTLMSLNCVPNAIQLADRRPQFVLLTNLLAALLVPLFYVLTVRYGPAGAASVWLAIGALHLIVPSFLMHRRILRGGWTRWYLVDLGLPALVSGAVAFAASAVATAPVTRIGVLAYLMAIWIFACLAVVAVTPDLRREILGVGRVAIGAWQRRYS